MSEYISKDKKENMTFSSSYLFNKKPSVCCILWQETRPSHFSKRTHDSIPPPFISSVHKNFLDTVSKDKSEGRHYREKTRRNRLHKHKKIELTIIKGAYKS